MNGCKKDEKRCRKRLLTDEGMDELSGNNVGRMEGILCEGWRAEV
jgi:hypothetical protein